MKPKKRKTTKQDFTPKKFPSTVNLTKEQKLYIKGHYGLIRRSELAKRVGLSKVDLNIAILNLGLGA